jgi:hypothetical protein
MRFPLYKALIQDSLYSLPFDPVYPQTFETHF